MLAPEQDVNDNDPVFIHPVSPLMSADKGYRPPLRPDAKSPVKGGDSTGAKEPEREQPGESLKQQQQHGKRNPSQSGIPIVVVHKKTWDQKDNNGKSCGQETGGN